MEAARFHHHFSCLGRALGSLAMVAACTLAWTSQRCVPGRVLVRFDTSLQRGLLGVPNLLGAVPVARLGHGEAMVLAVPRGANEAAFARQLSRTPGVLLAEPDYLFELQATPNDPEFPRQWHLAKVEAPAAWDYGKGSATVVLAVIDSGVDPNHPDLKTKLLDGWNTMANNANWADDNGHGTAVAGTAAAVTDNALGVAGMAWNCRILPVKATGSDGVATSSTLYNGLVWAADRGAKVANLSFKATANSFVSMGMQYFASKGGVVTVSAGNDAARATTPDNPYCLTVAATNASDQKTSWSAFGTNLDLAAPGDGVLTTNRGGGYGFWAGTSFSAPLVAGAAALVMAANPSLTPAQVAAILKDSADDMGNPGWDETFGAGRLNARKALYAALLALDDQEEPTVSINSPGSGPLSGTVQIRVDATDNVFLASIELFVNGTRLGSSNASPATFPWDTSTAPNGNVLLVAKAKDLHGNEGYAELPVVVRNGDRTPPTVSFENPTNGANLWGRINVRINAQDNEQLRSVRFFVNNTLIRTFTTAPFEMSWSSASVPDGRHTLRAVAEDAAGNRAETQVTVNVVNFVDNTPPTVGFVFPQNGQRLNGSVLLNINAQDDRQVRQVRLFVNNTLVRTFTAPPYAMHWSTRSVPNGTYTLRAEALDGLGNRAEASVTVLVDNDSTDYADNEAPVVSFLSPANGQTVSGILNIEIDARDNVGVESIQFFADGVLIRTFTSGPYRMQWSSRSVWDGPRVLRAVARDKKGNTSTAEITINVRNL
ncbi:MAG: Ig-like domain-containing protein [Fimbriimonadales bacterium]|nr:Ig-like domain-containing protein [Fimbriimonadales bacterium]